MKIRSLTIENLRSYKEPLTVTFDDLTVLIGKNDVGKSTLLEALDVFFENRNLDKNDVNIHASKFSSLPISNLL